MAAVDLFTPVKVGNLTLPNRIAMAPMTRGRAPNQAVPGENVAKYYADRADVGLIITEATGINPQGHGWAGAPQIYTDDQVAGWKKVVEAVHAKGGHIFLQLWHMGRVSHPDFQPNGELPVGPSAVAAVGEAHTPSGKKPYVVPRELAADELPGVVAAYATAARRAVHEAGFDGVEIHGANGYLLDQFTRESANHRTDKYGGSIENRLRLPLEVVDAVVKAVGADRVGYRVSPSSDYNDMRDSQPVALFTEFAKRLNHYNLAYLHVLEPVDQKDPVLPFIRAAYKGTIIVNQGYNKTTGNAALAAGHADIIAYGVPLLANPDLVKRFTTDAPLNTPQYDKMFFGGEDGYNDYPLLQN